METIDISGKVKNLIRFGLIFVLATAGAIGYGVFEHYHSTRELRIEDAKVTGTMVSVRTLVNGKVSEFLFEDGAEVKAGDVIARLEVKVTEEMIQQLENTVELAKANYEELKQGKWVKVPVKRMRAVRTPVTTSTTTTRPGGGGAASLASLKERADRMRELFEMGAVSAVQRDAAVKAYEDARRRGSGTSSYSTSGVTYETRYVEEIEYVDQLQPTPPAILYGAENAVKQAELSLNVALQEAQQTEIIAPVDGTIYYSVEPDNELVAGDAIAKVSYSKELWIAAEVSEETFNKVELGKLVSYVIDGKNLSGIVIDKIEPDPIEEEVTEENSDAETATTENKAEENLNAENSTVENSSNENATETATTENQTVENSNAEKSTVENQTDAPPRNDKYILRVSLPEERNFDCKPNSTTTLKIRI